MGITTELRSQGPQPPSKQIPIQFCTWEAEDSQLQARTTGHSRRLRSPPLLVSFTPPTLPAPGVLQQLLLSAQLLMPSTLLPLTASLSADYLALLQESHTHSSLMFHEGKGEILQTQGSASVFVQAPNPRISRTMNCIPQFQFVCKNIFFLKHCGQVMVTRVNPST